MTWFEILKECRKLEEFTSGALSERIGLPMYQTTAWIGKLRGWGYLRPTGEKRRRFVVYEITSWGREKHAPQGKQAKRRRNSP